MNGPIQCSRWRTVTKNDTTLLPAQINEILEEIPQALIQFNTTKNTVLALQTKLHEIKTNVSKVLLQLGEANRDIMNTTEEVIEDKPTIQSQELLQTQEIIRTQEILIQTQEIQNENVQEMTYTFGAMLLVQVSKEAVPIISTVLALVAQTHHHT